MKVANRQIPSLHEFRFLGVFAPDPGGDDDEVTKGGKSPSEPMGSVGIGRDEQGLDRPWPFADIGLIGHGVAEGQGMEIRQDDPAAPHVAALLAHHLRELQAVMAGHAFALDAAGLSAAGVTFWTAWAGAELVGFGALKDLGDGHGEVKSMRAAPAARGTGVGRALLDHIVAEARRRGYRRLSLETGTAPLHAPAIALYRRAGFVSCDAFAGYRPSSHNQFMTLDLSG